jgi:hypothetical protein
MYMLGFIKGCVGSFMWRMLCPILLIVGLGIEGLKWRILAFCTGSCKVFRIPIPFPTLNTSRKLTILSGIKRNIEFYITFILIFTFISLILHFYLYFI